jgi:hypothetical protein
MSDARLVVSAQVLNGGYPTTGNPCLRMKADCVPPSSSHARTTCAATSAVHLVRRAASNHAGSVFVVAVFVVIAPRTPRPLQHLHYLGWIGGLLLDRLVHKAHRLKLTGDSVRDPERNLTRSKKGAK